jgi:protein-ribulosamine 3-kinase
VIDWPALAHDLAAQSGESAGRVRSVPLAGGSINSAFRLESDAGRYFVKLNRAARKSMFLAEQRGLEAIRASAAIRVPGVYQVGCESDCAYIVLEYIELTAAPAGDRLAQDLAAMHACVQPRFGFEIDNTIGSTPQVNRRSDDWVEFWRLHRLEYQLALARHNGMPSALLDSGARLAQQLGHFFESYRPLAALLHGDLWSGNYAADGAGNPVIYDPACYYGDHEADLAMLELFGNPGERFFACYRERFPIDAGYPLRRDLYNLYHLLNHANLFGGSYVAQSQRVIDRLLAQLR